MAQTALRVRERKGECSGSRVRVAVLSFKRYGGLAIRGDAGREREPHGRTRDQPDPLAKTEDRVEEDAPRAGQRPPAQGGRPVGVTTGAEESCTIGLPFNRSLRPAFEAQDVHRPHRSLLRIPRASMTEKRWVA